MTFDSRGVEHARNRAGAERKAGRAALRLTAPTDAHKAAVWAAIAQPRCGYGEIAAITGLTRDEVIAVVVEARRGPVKHITIDDSDRQNIRIGRAGTAA